MKKNILVFSFAFLTLFGCKKNNDSTPATPEIAVADANGMVERFNFDGNLNGVRRTNITFSNPNNATVTGTDRRGNANRALVVPANAGLTIEGLPLVTGNGSRTIFCWIHPNVAQGSHLGTLRYFVGYGSGANGQGFTMLNEGTGFGGSISGDAVSTPYSFFYNESGGCAWIPVAFVYNQSTNKIIHYFSSTTTGKSEKTPTTTINTTGTTLRIGLDSNGTTTGQTTFMIDDVMIYNRALTDSEINTLMADGRPNCS